LVIRSFVHFSVSWTLYVSTVTSANAAEIEHPIFDPGVTQSDRSTLERQVRPLLEATDAELLAMVPKRNGLLFCGCPNCVAGSHELGLEWLGWQEPDKVKCRFCNMIFPNEQYPEDQTITATNPKNKRVTYRYYRNDGGTFYFSARARYSFKVWLSDQVLRLAQLAHLSKDPSHQRKAILLLDAFSQRYPSWCVMSDRSFQESGPLDSHPNKPHPYYGGIWSRWFYGDIPQRLLLAYDLLYDSDLWQKLSTQKGRDIRRRLEDDVFHASVQFVRGYDEQVSNKSPVLYKGLVIAGRVLAKPDYVHDAIDRLQRLVQSQFLFDGIWREGSASYHRATLDGLQRVIDVADGYSDPPGYRWPQDESRFDQLDVVARFPFLRRAKRAKSALVYPDGRIVPVHDGWAHETSKRLEPPRTQLLSAMEHCCLHRGQGAGQMQARLHFAPGYGHKHRDLLSLLLWAGGRELLSDIGYTHTNYRKAWAVSTPAHNTVVVDETEQKTDGDRSDVTLFDTAPGLLNTVEATATAAYPKLTSTYRRQLILVESSSDNAYVVDVFRVAGGNRHDWLIHGSADFNQKVTTSLALEPVAGTLLGRDVSIRMPVHERDAGDAEGHNFSYSLIRDLAQTTTDAQWNATFRFDQDVPIALRTTMLGQPGTMVVSARCPSIRPAGEDNSKLDEFTMPIIAVRRQGQNLSSTFVAIHEPFRRRPFIQSIRRLTAQSDVNGVVALEVTTTNQRDIVICVPTENAKTKLTISGNPSIEMAGRTGFVRLRKVGGDWEVTDAYLLDGTYLRCSGVELRESPALFGEIKGVLRDGKRFGFHISAQPPSNEKLRGRTILVTLPDHTRHGYRIDRIESTTSGSLILLDNDPGFAMADEGIVKFLYYPQRELKGLCQYRILNSVRWKRSE
jgi:hypothetical protein